MQFLILAVTMRVASTLLSPVEFGKASLLVATTAFFAFFFINPIGMFVNRRLHSWQINGAARHYFFYYINYLFFIAIIAAVILYFVQLYGWLNSEIHFIWLATLVCGSIFFSTITLTAIPSLNLLGESSKFLVLTVAMAVSSLLFAIFFIYINKPAAQYWLMGQLVGQTVIGAIGVGLLYKFLRTSQNSHKRSSIRNQQLRSLFSFAWPVAVAASLGWIQSQGYRYIIENNLGLMELGLFVAGYGVSAGLIAGFESILTTYFQPRMYRDVTMANLSDQEEAWRVYASSVIPPLILTVTFIMILAPELTQLFLGETFQSAEKYVVWGGLAECARVLIGVYSLIAHVFMRTKLLIFPNIIGAVSSVILCIILMPGYGAIGVGIGLSISGFLIVLTMHIMLKRYIRSGLPNQPIALSFFCSLALLIASIMVRQLPIEESNFSYLYNIILVGMPYLGMQYFLVRNSTYK